MKGHVSLKIVILLFVFLLSGIFFITISQRFLYPSRAAETPATIFFEVSDISAHVGDTIDANIFISVPQNHMIKKASVVLDYPQESLDVLPEESQDPSSVCDNNGYYLRTMTVNKQDGTMGSIILARQAESLQSVAFRPLFCWGTVRFKITKSSPNPLIIALGQSQSGWSIAGPLENFKPLFGDNKVLKVNVE